jgi:hypothetical protein
MEFYLGFILIFVSLGLLVFALARRRVGDEPYCKRCKFELTGLIEPERCPECGRGLEMPRSIRIGKSGIKPRPMLWGFFLLVLGSVFVGFDAMNRSGFINVTSIKPIRLLYTEAYLLDDRRASVATLEIENRAVMGQIGPEWKESVLQIALDRHSQTWRSFPNAQWRFIVDAVEMGELEPDRIDEIFLDAGGKLDIVQAGWNGQSVYPGEWVEVRANIEWRAGEERGNGIPSFHEDLFVMASAKIQPVGTRTRIGKLHNNRANLTINTIPPKKRAQAMQFMPVRYMYDLTPSFQVPPDLPPGTYRAKLIVDAKRFNSTLMDISEEESMYSEYEDMFSSKTLEDTFSFTVVDSGSQDPVSIHVSQYGRATNTQQQFIRFHVEDVFEQYGSLIAEYDIGRLGWLSENTGLAGVLVFEQDGKEIKSPPFCLAADPMIGQSMFGMNDVPRVILDGFHAGTVNVRYETYPGIARNYRYAMDRVLQGPLPLQSFQIPEGVPIRKPKNIFE